MKQQAIEQQSREVVNRQSAVVWARVSTHDQAETSLPSQVSRCKESLEQAGYTVTRILSADWTSLDLYSCSQFQELRELIRNREVAALAIFDRDRLEAKGLQRLVFLSELKEAGVKLIICQGAPIIDGPEGQLVELALAIGKEKQVLRARQGSRDGLRDRAVSRRLPVTFHKLFGYQWDKLNNKLLPDDNWDTLKLIFDLLLKGNSYDSVIRELKQRSISSPGGLEEWNKSTLSAIVHNPSYTGKYYALKKRAIEPVQRRGQTYGNSSCQKVPLEESVYIPEIEVTKPPITWERRAQILNQLASHQKLAQRHAKRDYLLRGIILCGTHQGKKGEPRIYHGQPHGKDSWRYVCPVGGCPRPYLNGPEMDAYAKGYFEKLMLHPSRSSVAVMHLANEEETAKMLRDELHQLELKHKRSIGTLATLEERFILGKVEAEVYQNLKDKYLNEQGWAKNRQRQVVSMLTQLSFKKDAFARLKELREQFLSTLRDTSTSTTKITQEDWRRLIVILNVKLYVDKEGRLTFKSNIALDLQQSKYKKTLQEVGDIVLNMPREVKHNPRVYPLYSTISFKGREFAGSGDGFSPPPSPLPHFLKKGK